MFLLKICGQIFVEDFCELSYANKTPTIIEKLFYSTFRLMRKTSSGINEMRQLE